MLNLVDPAKMSGMRQLFGLRDVAIAAGDGQGVTECRQEELGFWMAATPAIPLELRIPPS